MKRHDDEWLEAIYLRDSVERAIGRLEAATTLTYEEMKTVQKLRAELRMIQARLAKTEEPDAD